MAGLKTPRVVSGVAKDMRAGRYPRALVVSVVAWVLLGVVMLCSTLGAPTPSNQDRTTQDAVDALNNTQIMAPSAQQSWWFPYLPVLGAVLVVVAVVLALGYGWARMLLALLGLVAVVALAQSASWLAIPAAFLLVIAAITGLLLSAHRYLRDGATTSPDPAGPNSSVSGRRVP